MRLIIHAINNNKHRFAQPLQLLQLVAKRYLSPTQVGSLPCALGGPQGGRRVGKTRQGAGVILGLQRSTVTPGPQGVPEIHHQEKAVDRFFLPPHLDIHFLNRGQLRRTLQMINV